MFTYSIKFRDSATAVASTDGRLITPKIRDLLYELVNNHNWELLKDVPFRYKRTSEIIIRTDNANNADILEGILGDHDITKL